jgi:hypothetical protein
MFFLGLRQRVLVSEELIEKAEEEESGMSCGSYPPVVIPREGGVSSTPRLLD